MKKEDIYYIVGLREEAIQNLKLTTINKEFCGKIIYEAYNNIYFELNGSGAMVIIPEKWISFCAPSKKLWKEEKTND